MTLMRVEYRQFISRDFSGILTKITFLFPRKFPEASQDIQGFPVCVRLRVGVELLFELERTLTYDLEMHYSRYINVSVYNTLYTCHPNMAAYSSSHFKIIISLLKMTGWTE